MISDFTKLALNTQKPQTNPADVSNFTKLATSFQVVNPSPVSVQEKFNNLKPLDEKISATPQSPAQKALSYLPEPLRNGFNYVLDDIKNGLFGNPKDKAALQEFQRQDVGQSDTALRLLSLGTLGNKAEGFLPILGRDNTDKVEHRIQVHEAAGVDPERAASLAFYEVFSGVNAVPGTKEYTVQQQAKERLAALKPTAEEKKTAMLATIGQNLGAGADILQFFPVGSVGKIGAKAAQEIAKTQDLTKIVGLLKKEIPTITNEGADVVGKMLVNVDNAEEVNRVLNRTKYAVQEMGKTKKTAPVAEDVSALTKVTPKASSELSEIKYTPIINDLSAQIVKKYPEVPRMYADQIAEDVRTLVQEGGRKIDDALRIIDERISQLPKNKTDLLSYSLPAKDGYWVRQTVSGPEYVPLIKGETLIPMRGLPDRPSSFTPNEWRILNEKDIMVTGDERTFWQQEFKKVIDELPITQQKKARDSYLSFKGNGTTIQNEVDALKKAVITFRDKGGYSRKMLRNSEFTPSPDNPSPVHIVPYEEKVASMPESKGTEILRTTDTPPSQEEIAHALDTQYTAGDGKSRDFDAATREIEITTNEPKEAERVTQTLREAKDTLVEFIQDTDKRILDLQNKGLNISDSSNVYQKLTLLPGKLGDIIEKTNDEVKTIIEDMAKMSGKTKKGLADIRGKVNEYLHALHAPERNAKLGKPNAAGMTDAEAKSALVRLKKDPRFEQIQEFASRIQEIHTRSLDMLYDSGVIKKSTYETLRETYKNHVPLNRVFEYEDIGESLSGRGLDVKSTGLRRAKGSVREVKDIVENIIVSFEQAAIRSQKNLVDLGTHQFVLENAEDLKDIMYFKRPGISLTTSDPHILQYYVDGVRKWIYINDVRLADAFKGTGRISPGPIINAVGSFTRLYAGLATRFNPVFALSNKPRDLQELAVYISSIKDMGAKGAGIALKEDPKSILSVIDYLRGKDTEGARLYAEMKEMGGTTGGMGLSTRKNVSLNIRKLEKLATSNTRKFVEKTFEYIDNWNTIFEDSTRLSAYSAARKMGLSKERAAFIAKEATVNFNRTGKGGPTINALYMFANASIQGSAKTIRSLRNPKVLMATAIAVGSAVTIVSEWNDKVDPDWRNKVTQWDRLNSLPVALPSEDGGVKYISIPISWGLKPIKVMADYAYDVATGIKTNAKQLVGDLFTSVVDAYNPLGGVDAMSAATPTILDIPLEIARNKKWSGSPIKPSIDPYAPDSIRYFESLNKTQSGRVSIGITKMLSDYGIEISPADLQYAYQQYVGGTGRFVNQVIDVGAGAIKGELPPISDFPFVSRFYKERQADELYSTQSTQTVRDLIGDSRKKQFYLKEKAQAFWNNIAEMAPEEKKMKLTDLAKTDEELFKKVVDVAEAEKMGLTSAEKMLKYAPVSVRATAILDEMNKLKTKEEKKALLKGYAEKKIVTVDVLKEMALLKEKQKENP